MLSAADADEAMRCAEFPNGREREGGGGGGGGGGCQFRVPVIARSGNDACSIIALSAITATVFIASASLDEFSFRQSVRSAARSRCIALSHLSISRVPPIFDHDAALPCVCFEMALASKAAALRFATSREHFAI